MSSLADLFINDVLKITGYSPSLTNSSTNIRIQLLFGSANQGAANLNLVRVETGTTVAPVPEPATLGIVASMIFAAIAWKRSRSLRPPSGGTTESDDRHPRLIHFRKTQRRFLKSLLLEGSPNGVRTLPGLAERRAHRLVSKKRRSTDHPVQVGAMLLSGRAV